MHWLSSSRGFTIIELSIVLVIIGLIIGGVLVGRDMIKAAEVRAELTQIERFKTAAFTFENKYNCLPGDCANAETLGLGVSGGPGGNGDGNGMVYSGPWVNGAPTPAQMQEHINFWYHLAKAGLVEGQFKGYTNESNYISTGDGYAPPIKVGKGWIFAFSSQDIYTFIPNSAISFGNFFYLASFAPPGPGNYDNFEEIIPALQARSIDAKIDDGLPYTGNVRAGSPYSGPMICLQGSWCDEEAMVGPYCIDGSDYDATSSDGKCMLAIGNAF